MCCLAISRLANYFSVKHHVNRGIQRVEFITIRLFFTFGDKTLTEDIACSRLRDSRVRGIEKAQTPK